MYVRTHTPTDGIADSLVSIFTGAGTGISAYKASSAQAELATQRPLSLWDRFRWPIIAAGGVGLFLVARKIILRRGK